MLAHRNIYIRGAYIDRYMYVPKWKRLYLVPFYPLKRTFIENQTNLNGNTQWTVSYKETTMIMEKAMPAKK